MSNWESQHDLGTVINRNQFVETVELKECELVGRSLVARRPITCGDTVLVETPLFQYFLEPNCRSSLSPFYSKKLWKQMKDIVTSEDPSIEQSPVEDQQHSSQSDSDTSDYDDSDYNDSDNDSDDEDDQSTGPTSPFIPGVPAAMLAFLQIQPPPADMAPFTQSSHFQHANPSSFDFFYYPSTDMDHSTVQLIHNTAKRIVKENELYHHVNPDQLSSFVLKIYGNAHTVALDRKANHRSKLTTLTHSKKRHRRQTIYAHRRRQQDSDDEDDHDDEPISGSWETTGPRPSIALMLWGSKFAHACSPNLLLQYDPPTNTMLFVATCDINSGDLLTFSYLPEDESLGGLVCGTTQGRRAKLHQFKFFECACSRCQGQDLCRGADCSECGKTTWYQGSTRTWSCESCPAASIPHFVLPSVEKGESYVERMVTGLATKLQNDGANSKVVHMMETYLNNLLQPEQPTPAIPSHHWTFGYIHGLLAIYHLELFSRTFGKGLASQLGLTETGLKEARLYIVDFLHERLWASNPVPVFFAAWRILAPVITVVIDGTEEKQYFVPAKKPRNPSVDGNSDDSDDDDTPAPVMLDPLVIAIPDHWEQPVCDMVDVVANQWVPLIKKIFGTRTSVVVDDMMDQIEKWRLRVQESRALAKL